MSGEIDTSRWRTSAAELVRLTRLDGEQILRSQALQFLLLAMRFTPPRSYAQGRAAVAGDIHRAVLSMDPARTTSEGIRDALIAKDENALRAIFGRNPKTKSLIVQSFTPQLHTSRRNKRGRVRTRSNVFTPDRDQLTKYTADVQRRVGYAKGGWVPSLRALGSSSIPAWIGRHSGAQSGRVIDRLGFPSPEITMINTATRIPNYNQTVKAALNSRGAVMNRLIHRILSNRPVNLGFTTYGSGT